VDNSAENSARGKPFQKGADPRRAVGRKGVGGRKTLEFKAECARLADEDVLPKLARTLAEAGPDDAAWRWAAEKVLDYSKQKVAQNVNLGAQDGGVFEFTMNLGAASVTDDSGASA
jgi:hypothetical protein